METLKMGPPNDKGENQSSLFFWPIVAFPTIWSFAFVLRLIYLVQVRHAPSFGILMGDAQAYDAWARDIAAGNWIGKEVFYQAPLYPYFLGLCYAIAGPNLWVVRIIQLTIGATACSLLAAAGWRFFTPRIGVIAGFMLALYPSTIFFDGLIQKTVLDNFFLAFLLWVASCLIERPCSPVLWALNGASIAFLTLSRENALVFLFLFLIWMVLAFRDHPWRDRGQWVAFLVIGVALVLLPVVWRNHHVGGGFQVTTSQLGTNLYIGNNARATGSYLPLRAGHGNAIFERREATDLAEQASGRKLSPSEVSSFWSGQAFAYMRAQPLRWLGQMANKVFLTWNAYELADTDDQYFAARWSSLLRGLTTVFHFGVICPIATIGIFLHPLRNRIWILHLLLVGYSLSVAVFYVFARYRYPLVPILALFAAAGIAQLVAYLRRGQYQKLTVAGAIAVSVALFVNWPPTTRNDSAATTLYNLAVARVKQGRLVEATDFSQQALRINPQHWGAHNIIGQALAGQGYPDKALHEFQIALQLAPESADLHSNVAKVLVALNRLPDALKEFYEAIRLEPGFAEAHNGLGVALAHQGDLIRAAEEFQRAIQLKPDYAEAQRNYWIVTQMQKNR